MTQDELDALPDVTEPFGQVQKVIDGRRVTIPTIGRETGAVFMGGETHMVIDVDGRKWYILDVNGVRSKRRA
jgi:hypothetical protein